MIIRIKKNKNYTVICNECLQRPDLSLKAKGLFAYLMSLPNDWKIYKKELVNHFKDGITAINSAFKELEKAGYISSKQIKDEKGRFIDVEYTIRESVEESQPILENLKSDSLISVNRTLQNTNKNKILKKQKDKEEDISKVVAYRDNSKKYTNNNHSTSSFFEKTNNNSKNSKESSLSLKENIEKLTNEQYINYIEQEFENIPEKIIKKWKQQYPDADVEVEMIKALDWLKNHPKKRRKDVKRFMTNWLKRVKPAERGFQFQLVL